MSGSKVRRLEAEKPGGWKAKKQGSQEVGPSESSKAFEPPSFIASQLPSF
jgi:hypothetical protein